jgi:hypothetical protein
MKCPKCGSEMFPCEWFHIKGGFLRFKKWICVCGHEEKVQGGAK